MYKIHLKTPFLFNLYKIRGDYMLKILIFLFRPLKSEDYRHDDDAEDFGRSIGLLSDYADAERYGTLTGDCGKLYGMCPFSIRSLLPKVFFFKSRPYFIKI